VRNGRIPLNGRAFERFFKVLQEWTRIGRPVTTPDVAVRTNHVTRLALGPIDLMSVLVGVQEHRGGVV
jgi:hypothetical protein